MAKIYISSTFEDLKEYREAVYNSLKKLDSSIIVIAMEDYVASDKRPLQKCLKDVASCDIYIGLFAWRYGFIPEDKKENPNELSITELEYRKAKEKKISCLIFLLNRDDWPLRFSDGTGQSGIKSADNINRLRNDLTKDNLSSFFNNPDNLASLIVPAVNKKLQDIKQKSKDSKLNKNDTGFSVNGNKAFFIIATQTDSAENIISTLELPIKPKSIILVFGGASGSLDTSDTSNSILHQILDDVLQYATDNDAIIIDGGTKSGIMEMIGQRASELDQRKKPVLLGVAPSELVVYPNSTKENDKEEGNSNKADLDPNHSHFVLVEGNRWGDETSKLFEIATALTAVEDIPIVALLAGGGKISKKEILFCIDKNWPIIVIEKTGYLADEIASSYKKSQEQISQNTFFDRIKKKFFRLNLQKRANTKASQDASLDAKLKKMVSYPSLQLFPSDSNQRKSSFEQFLLYVLNYDPLLKSAWQSMALYDESAKRLQNNFNRFQKFILGIGVLATSLAILQTQYKISSTPFNNIINFFLTTLSIKISPNFFNDIPYYVLIILPITTSILIAALNRFRYGAKWVLLRAAAEAIKGEIYHYRTKSFLYSQEKDKNQTTTTLTSKEELSSRIRYIKSSLMKTDVSLHGLYEYNGPLPPKMYGAAEKDDGYSILSAEQYIKIRIDDQISYYQKTTFKLENQLKILQWLILLSGGAGTFLAAIHFQIWIALTTTLVATFVSFLEYKQIENTLIKYNQTRIELENIKSWWDSLSTSEKIKKEKRDELVQKTEDVLRTELSGWVRQMQVTIDKLYTKKEAAKEEEDKTSTLK